LAQQINNPQLASAGAVPYEQLPPGVMPVPEQAEPMQLPFDMEGDNTYNVPPPAPPHRPMPQPMRPRMPVMAQSPKPVQQATPNGQGGLSQMLQHLPELRQAVLGNDLSKFPKITNILGMIMGGQDNVVQSIKAGQLDAKTLCNYVLMVDNSYKNQQNWFALQKYTDAYIKSFGPSSKITTKCPMCQTEFDFDSMQQWEDEKGENDGKVICGKDDCPGELQLVQ
jgi:hypothetical protein